MRKHAKNIPFFVVQLEMPADIFKAFLRDLLGREAGQPYFKYLVIPRRYRWLGAWQRLSTYRAEQQLLPIGGRQLDERIRQFFMTYGVLRALFQKEGMPLYAIHLLHRYAEQFPEGLARILQLDCRLHEDTVYKVTLRGAPELPPQPST